MQGVNPRRSACDRCRSHKLRCVRLDQSTNPEALMACQRCLRAGTDCVHTIHLRGRASRDHDSGRHHMPVPSSSAHAPVSYHQMAVDHDFSFDMVSAATAAAAPPPPPPSQQPLPGYFDTTAATITGTNHHSLGQQQQRQQVPPPQIQQNHLSTASPSNSNSSGGSRKSNGDSRAKCLHRLSELSSRLLVDFGKPRGVFTSSSTVDMMYFTSTPWSTWQDQHKQQQDSANNLREKVRKLFESLHIFLETVERLRPPPSPPPEPQPPGPQTMMASSAASECSYSSQWDESEFVHMPPEGTPTTATHRHHQLHHHNHHHQMGGAGPAGASHGSINGSGAPPTPEMSNSPNVRQQPALDLPATLTVLTCYIWLLKGYEMVLSGIQETLRSHIRIIVQQQQQQQQPGYPSWKPTLPSIFSHTPTTATTNNATVSASASCSPASPEASSAFSSPSSAGSGGRRDATQGASRGSAAAPPPTQSTTTTNTPVLQLGGLALDDHPDMQIELVMHVGSQLLHRIEGCLGIHIVSERQQQQQQQQNHSHHRSREVVDAQAAAALLDIWLPRVVAGAGDHGRDRNCAAGGGGGGGSGGSSLAMSAGDHQDPYGGRRVQINRTVDDIRGLLREYWRVR